MQTLANRDIPTIGNSLAEKTRVGFIQVLETRDEIIWFDRDLLPDFDPTLFNPDNLADNGLLKGNAAGRNPVWFFAYKGQDFALRHYWRGGLWGKLVKDLYLYAPAPESRAMAEFAILGQMYDLGLPVPRPAAARFSRHGIFYRADLVTQKIPDTKTLLDMVGNSTLPKDLWIQIGASIARFHNAGFFHPDLNCRNILMSDDGAVWILDFDRARVCDERTAQKKSESLRRNNLNRLHRSLEKQKNLGLAKFWRAEDWPWLIEGYRAECP